MVRTAVGLMCDPECKWRAAVDELITDKTARMDAVPHDTRYGEDDPRPTTEGYEQQKKISPDYQGIHLLFELGRGCARACGIERYVENNPNASFGPLLQAKINDLKGV